MRDHTKDERRIASTAMLRFITILRHARGCHFLAAEPYAKNYQASPAQQIKTDPSSILNLD